MLKKYEIVNASKNIGDFFKKMILIYITIIM